MSILGNLAQGAILSNITSLSQKEKAENERWKGMQHTPEATEQHDKVLRDLHRQEMVNGIVAKLFGGDSGLAKI